MNMQVLKVSGTTKPSSLAGKIVKTLKEVQEVKVTAIGDKANNQMNKAMAVSNQYLAPEGKRLDIIPAFGELTEDGREITTLSFFLKIRYM